MLAVRCIMANCFDGWPEAATVILKMMDGSMVTCGRLLYYLVPYNHVRDRHTAILSLGRCM